MDTGRGTAIKTRGARRIGLKRSSQSGRNSLSSSENESKDNSEPLSDPPAVNSEPDVKSDAENGSLDEKPNIDSEDADAAINAEAVDEPKESTADTDLNDSSQSDVISIDSKVMEAAVTGEEEAQATLETDPPAAPTEIEPPVPMETDADAEAGEESDAECVELALEDEDGSSEETDDFRGFQSLPSPTTKPLLTKLLGDAQSELEKENNLSSDEKMDIYQNSSNDETDIENGKADEKVKVKKEIEENGTDDSETKEADGSFDNMKLLSEVSSEVTSSNDVSKTNNTETPKVEEEAASEVTSSATNSPSISLSQSRGTGKGAASRKSPASSSKRTAPKKSSVDLSSPAFRKPFEFGWKRELVYRNSNENSTRIQADIYYYTPGNKKIRSNREVSDHLHGSDLSLENFTFIKEALGVEDPTKEVIRVAKRVSIGGSPLVKKPATPKAPKPPKESPPANDSPDAVKPTGPRAASRGFPRIKITPSQLLRSSPNGPKGKGKRNKAPVVVPTSDEGDMEMGMLPPSWNQTSVKTSKKRKRDPEKETSPTNSPTNKRTKKATEGGVELEDYRRKNPMQYTCEGYKAILQVFQYLKVKELMRAARVCKMWRDIAGHRTLWHTVRMKNCQVDDWEGFVSALVRHNTEHLDLRKMLLPTDNDEVITLWRSFVKEIRRATHLVRIDLCRCPGFVVEDLADACPQLTVLNALAISSSAIAFDNISNFTRIQELRLKSMTGIHLTSSLEGFKNLTQLKHLALTTFKDLGAAGPEVISCLTDLEALEIGECSDFTEDFSKDVLSKLTKLKSLRLEKGQGKTCPTFSLLVGVKELPTLCQLELVNFDVKAGFTEALAMCTNIKRLLIIPTYVTQSATTNHMVLAAVTELKDTLSHFVWGVTNELLRVTELFIDQCEGKTKKPKTQDSIPILRPDKSKEEWEKEDCQKMTSPVGQVEIVTLGKLQQLLVKRLPNTKIKILKVPFQSTWRQSISEPNL